MDTTEEWRISSYSGVNNCVAVRLTPEGANALRDTKDPNRPALSFSNASAIGALVTKLKNE